MCGIYIHIPFCVQKCLYCDFLSFAGQEALYKPYTDAVVREIRESESIKRIEITTVFFGGGTPTALPPSFLCQILEAVTKHNMSRDPEITVEANPGTLNQETLRMLKASGVNRLSIGLQAWQNHLLRALGRVHDREVFLRNLYNAGEAGFDNIGVDLMFALPGQTEDDWRETLKAVTGLGVRHISAYGLTVEEDTPFGRMQREGVLCLPDEDTDRRMYEDAKAILADRGYMHYEISNFAHPGYESRHNMAYWERGPYLGFGVAAHSFFDGCRYNNTDDLGRYIRTAWEGLPVVENNSKLTENEAMEETMFLGLRMMKGVSPDEFEKRFGVNIYEKYGHAIDKCIARGLLKLQNGRLALTERGVDISNTIFAEFLL